MMNGKEVFDKLKVSDHCFTEDNLELERYIKDIRVSLTINNKIYGGVLIDVDAAKELRDYLNNFIESNK